MGFLEKTGKNVDEALEQALNELKTTRDKVNIEVIEEAKNGLFGLFSKKAKIRVTLKDAAAKIGDVVEEALDNIKADVQAGKEEYKNTAVDTDTEAAVKKEFVVDEEAVQAGKEFLQKIFHSMKIEVVAARLLPGPCHPQRHLSCDRRRHQSGADHAAHPLRQIHRSGLDSGLREGTDYV